MAGTRERSRENSILSEIRSLAPYFPYQNGEPAEDVSRPPVSPSRPSGPEPSAAQQRVSWQERREEYVAS